MRKRKKENAQGMVEFALVLPILLLVIVGIMEMGRLLFFYSSVVSASREGARYASAVGDVGGVPRYAYCDGIREAALKAGSFADLEGDDIDIVYDDGNDPYPDDCDNPPSDGISLSLADRVVVTASGTFNPVIPLISVFFPDDGLEVNSVTARTVIKDVPVPGTPRPADPVEPLPPPFCPPTELTALSVDKTIDLSIPNPKIDYVYHLQEIEIDFPDDPSDDPSFYLDVIRFTNTFTDDLTLTPEVLNYYDIKYEDPDVPFIWHGRFDDPGIMRFTFRENLIAGDYEIKVWFSQCDYSSFSTTVVPEE